MPNYKPIKIIFDIDDPYQLAQYNHIKERSNSSSYIRTLVQLDMVGHSKEPMNSPPNEIVKEHKIDSSKSIAKIVTVQKVNYQPTKILVNQTPIATIDEDDIDLDDFL